jgi:hypothetical protein
VRYGVPADSSELFYRHGLACKNPRVNVSKTAKKWATIWLEGHLLYEERNREPFTTVRELDEKMNRAATSRVMFGNNVQVLKTRHELLHWTNIAIHAPSE